MKLKYCVVGELYFQIDVFFRFDKYTNFISEICHIHPLKLHENLWQPFRPKNDSDLQNFVIKQGTLAWVEGNNETARNPAKKKKG